MRGEEVLSEHVEERKAIQACDGFGEGEYVLRYPDVAVRIIRAISDVTPPGVPSGFSASAATASSVSLTWTANGESDFSNYVIWKSVDGVNFGYLGSSLTNSYTDTDSAVGSGVLYYQISALDVRGNTSARTSAKSAGPYSAPVGWSLNLPASISFNDGAGDQYFSFGPYLTSSNLVVTALDPASTESNQIAATLPAQLSITNETPPRLKFTDSAGGTYGPVNFKWKAASTAEADWQSRISASGVVWYHSFDTANEVRNFRWNNASPAFGMDPNDLAHPNTCVWDSTGGVDGGGALRLRYPVGTNHASAWGRPYSPIVSGTTTGNGRTSNDPGASPISWNPSQSDALRVVNTGWYGHSSYSGDAAFDGTEYWVQFRFKIDSDRYLNTGGNGTLGAQGGKLLYLDARDGSNQEIIWTNGKIPYFLAYTNFGSPTLAGPGNAIQYGSQWPNCGIIDPPATYCYLMPADTWVTWLWHVRLGRQSTNETWVEVFVKDSRYAADYNGYTRVFNYNLISMNYSSGKPRGHNVLHLTNYFNNWQNDYEWFSWYDQVIFSTQFIAAPTV